jgi:hypothetical protein
MQVLTYTVVFRESNTAPQEEFVRYSAQAAASFAKLVQDNGGVAIVVEGAEELPDHDEFSHPANQHNPRRSSLEW